MALTRTSISAAITANALTIPITSTSSGFPTVGATGSRQLMQVDGEFMLIDVVPVANQVKVLLRGYNGTTAVAHDILAPVTTSSQASDFIALPEGSIVPREPYDDDIVAVGQNGVIPVPVKNTTVLLTKATALSATTLAAPAVDNDGVRLTIINMTAAAHVITATSLINDGVTGAPHSTLTFGAFAGASIVLEAAAGLWNVLSINVCPVT